MDRLSPFYSLLGTNYSLNEEETSKLVDYLVEPIAQIAKLQEEINCAKARLDALFKHYRSLSEYIEAHRALTAPIRRVSDDVLQQIFLFCLPEAHDPVISRHHCPILLTHICRSWRHTALASKSLWASIHIAYSNHPQRQATAIIEWLKRAGSYTLDISMYSAGYDSVFQDIILDALLAFSSRWGSLRFKTLPKNILNVLSYPGNFFPRLHTIALLGIADRRLHPPSLPEFFILQAPMLRCITYSNWPGNVLHLHLRWEQLTSISLDDMTSSASQLSRILRVCPLLSYLKLKSYTLTEDTSSSTVSTPITLHHLKDVTFQSDRPQSGEILDILILPSLQRLDFNSRVALAQLESLLERTGQTLLELVLEPEAHPRDKLISCLGFCINLTKLEFQIGKSPLGGARPTQVMPLDDNFLRRLLGTSSGKPVFLPRLTTFVCCVLFGPNSVHFFSDLGTVEVIQQRTAATNGRLFSQLAQLKMVDIVFSIAQKHTILSQIKALGEAGVECRFNFPPSDINKTEKEPYSATDGTVPFPKILRWDTIVF